MSAKVSGNGAMYLIGAAAVLSAIGLVAVLSSRRPPAPAPAPEPEPPGPDTLPVVDAPKRISDANAAHAAAVNQADPAAQAMFTSVRAVFGSSAPAFDPRLSQLIAGYQLGAQIGVDGELGPGTRSKLAAQRYLEGVGCAGAWPRPGADQASFFRGMAGVPAGAAQRPLLLAIRGAYPLATHSHRSIFQPIYDDTLVLVELTGKVTLFACSTHAFQLKSSESPDVGGAGGAPDDGIGDVASIRPGRYLLALQSNDPPEFALTLPNGDGDIPAFRDTDHDGIISVEEAERAETATTGPQVEPGVGMTANFVLLHPGFDVDKPGAGRKFGSIACQTAPLDVVTFLAKTSSHYDYVLRDASSFAAVA